MQQFVPGDVLAIADVDMYGWLGRDRHPHPRHAGRLAIVQEVEHFIDCDPEEGGGYDVIHAETLTGERLELMPHEVVGVSCPEQPGWRTSSVDPG